VLEKLRAELKAIWGWPVFKDEKLSATEMAAIHIRKARALELIRKIEKIVQNN